VGSSIKLSHLSNTFLTTKYFTNILDFDKFELQMLTEKKNCTINTVKFIIRQLI